MRSYGSVDLMLCITLKRRVDVPSRFTSNPLVRVLIMQRMRIFLLLLLCSPFRFDLKFCCIFQLYLLLIYHWSIYLHLSSLYHFVPLSLPLYLSRPPSLLSSVYNVNRWDLIQSIQYSVLASMDEICTVG